MKPHIFRAIAKAFLRLEIHFTLEHYGHLIDRWKEPHRYYHNLEHLEEIIELILDGFDDGWDRDALILAALFHDIVYNPLSKTNEEDSADMWMKLPHNCKDEKFIETVNQIILDTKDHEPRTKLSKWFIEMDLHGLSKGDVARQISDGMKIMKEYQHYDYADYRIGRDKVIEHYMNKLPGNRDAISAYLSWLKWYRPRVGIYAGSFNPFHIGHMEILRKAEKSFDKVIVAIGINPDKENVSPRVVGFEGDIRKSALQKALPFHQVEVFQGLLTDYIAKKEETGIDVTLIKGLRDGDDLKYEMNQLRFMERMVEKDSLRVVYIAGGAEFAHVSSSAIRSLIKIDPKLAEPYLPTWKS